MMRDDDAGALFARLTSLLEDAAGSGEGQNPRPTPPIRRALLLQTGQLLAEADLTAQRLSQLLDGR